MHTCTHTHKQAWTHIITNTHRYWITCLPMAHTHWERNNEMASALKSIHMERTQKHTQTHIDAHTRPHLSGRRIRHNTNFSKSWTVNIWCQEGSLSLRLEDPGPVTPHRRWGTGASDPTMSHLLPTDRKWLADGYGTHPLAAGVGSVRNREKVKQHLAPGGSNEKDVVWCLAICSMNILTVPTAMNWFSFSWKMHLL